MHKISGLIGCLWYPLVSSDIVWPEYAQNCRDDAGPLFQDDEENFPNGGKYHDGSAAQPVLQADGECSPPLQAACASRPIKTAYMEGPIDCGDQGWYCRITPDANWPALNLLSDVNFGHCNSTAAFDDAGYDGDGHCHGSDKDNTYYWWMRDHFHRQYNGNLRCCCGWYAGTSTTPMYSRRIANRCDYRRPVSPTENLEQCRDANEDHGLGFDDIGCDPQYQSAQLGRAIPEDDSICWEITRFGYTEEKYDTPVTDKDDKVTDTPTSDTNKDDEATDNADPDTPTTDEGSDTDEDEDHDLVDNTDVDVSTNSFRQQDRASSDSQVLEYAACVAFIAFALNFNL